MAHRKCTGNFTVNESNVLHITLSELSRMTLVNLMTFVVLKISYNLVSILNFLFQSNC